MILSIEITKPAIRVNDTANRVHGASNPSQYFWLAVTAHSIGGICCDKGAAAFTALSTLTPQERLLCEASFRRRELEARLAGQGGGKPSESIEITAPAIRVNRDHGASHPSQSRSRRARRRVPRYVINVPSVTHAPRVRRRPPPDRPESRTGAMAQPSRIHTKTGAADSVPSRDSTVPTVAPPSNLQANFNALEYEPTS